MLAAIGLAAVCAGSTRAAPSGSWTGTFTVPASAAPVQIAVVTHGGTATVSLGPGHASATDVRVTSSSTRMRFAFPGLPDDIVFSGTVTRERWSGTVTQGGLRGTFSLARGTAPALTALGLYRSAAGAAVAVVQAKGLPTWLVELPSGRVHGLNASLTTAGRLLGETRGDGTLTVEPDGLTWAHVRYRRVRLRQWETRVGSLGATLTLPPGPGPFPAAALVHGSDAVGREEFQVFAAYLESIGVAVLAADKRGVGQSGGSVIAQSSEEGLRALAADAARQVDYLAARNAVDARRVGLVGDSQAGWTIALAAASDRRVRWAVPLVGPTTTVAETDLFTTLAGAEQRKPSSTRGQMLRAVRAAGRGGFDPLPSLRRVAVPVFWVFGDDDRNVPTELCLERLRSIAAGHRFSWTVLPMTHALLDLPTGLYSSLGRSPGFAPRLFPAVGSWLAARGIT